MCAFPTVVPEAFQVTTIKLRKRMGTWKLKNKTDSKITSLLQRILILAHGTE